MVGLSRALSCHDATRLPPRGFATPYFFAVQLREPFSTRIRARKVRGSTRTPVLRPAADDDATAATRHRRRAVRVPCGGVGAAPGPVTAAAPPRLARHAHMPSSNRGKGTRCHLSSPSCRTGERITSGSPHRDDSRAGWGSVPPSTWQPD